MSNFSNYSAPGSGGPLPAAAAPQGGPGPGQAGARTHAGSRAPPGDGWSGREWAFGTENDCDRLWWTMPWVDRWGRDLSYRD